MARIAFILDRLFRRFGVSGRAFIPMIMGFGCSVPAIINTRTLTDERERTLTIRTIPFFSCGAKLPILVAVSGAVAYICGLGDGGFISFAMYVLGMAVAVVSILLMRNTTQKGEVAPFIMELPPYRKPSGKALAVHLWDKTKHYSEKAFTVILASTILVWFLSNFLRHLFPKVFLP
jgi:ferrous iron transport protein B